MEVSVRKMSGFHHSVIIEFYCKNLYNFCRLYIWNKRGRKILRNDYNRKTEDFKNMKYSPELISQLSDPEYAKEEERYARQARRSAGRRSRSSSAKHSGRRSAKENRKGCSGSSSSRREQNMRASGKREKNGAGRDKKKKKYKFRPLKLVRSVLILLLAVLLAFTGLFYGLTGNFDKIDTDKDVFAIDSNVEDELSGYRNIAILGSDARSDEGYDGSRTDAIIVMSIKKSTGDIRLISVMRDSYLQMEYMDGTQILDKVTHANHWKDAANVCASLNQSLDLNIDEFVMFNWKAVADAVDCLGGIEINVRKNEMGDMNIWGNETARNVGREYHRIEKSGRQTLDGVQATTYCRIRKNSGGDAGRSRRYKQVVAATMKKAMLQPWKLGELSDTVFPQIRTNMSRTAMYTAVLSAPRYSFGKSVSWPRDYWSGNLGGIDYVVPQTLESNVKWLHEKAFEQENYRISDTCAQISESISADTGVY